MKNKYFLYISLSLIPLIIIIISFVFLLQSPYTGLNFAMKNDKWYISGIDPDSPASRHPDLLNKEVLAIGNHQLNRHDLKKDFDAILTWHDLQDYWTTRQEFEQNIKIGSPLRINIQENSELQNILITPTSFPLQVILSRVGVYVFTGIIFLFVGLIIILKKHKETYAKVLFITFWLAGPMQVLMGIVFASDIMTNSNFLKIIYIANSFENIFATALTLHFLAIFPKDPYKIQTKKWVIALFYLLSACVYFIYVFKILPPVFPLFMIFAIISGVYFMIINYFKSNPIEKAQIRWLYIGVGLFIISALLLTYIPLAVLKYPIINEQYGSLVTILFPLAMVFSILRYRLMDIDSLVDNTLIYVITLGLLALMDIGIVTFLIDTQFFNVSTPVAIAVSIWVAALVYIQVRNLVQKQIKRILKREVYDINQTSIQLGKKLFSVNNIKEAFAKTNVIIHETLYPKSSNAYLFNENTYIPLWESKKYNLPLDTNSIKNIKEAIPLYKLIDTEILPDDCSGGVIVPVIGTNKVIGYFVFQDKQSDRLYDNEDIKLLNILTKQLAMAIEAIQMREELKQKEVNDFKEKERISREIHDGIGSRFVDAILLSDAITKDVENSSKILKHAAELKKTLLEGLTDLRELIWTVEPGQNTLGNLISYIVDKAQHINNKENIKATVNTSIEDENINISSSIKLNLVRIIQEAITNTIKHAGATKIDVSIEQTNKYLKIEISDNGKGFDSLNMHSKGYGIRNIKKRCEDIGAKISISSQTDNGAAITITMELP